METAQTIISIIGLIGIGGLLKSSFDYFFVEKRKIKDLSRHELKELRYKAIIILCYCLLKYDSNKEKLNLHRPDLKSREELLDEIELEWLNMTLYASSEVIKTTKQFIQFNTKENLMKMLFAMRKSLYKIKTDLEPHHLEL